MAAIHQNLKLLRQAQGMTQADVADAIHVTRQTISSYESGRTQPDIETIKRLAEVYQVDILDILYGTNRLQRRMKVLKRSIYGLVALFLLGLLLHSVLLWAMDAYFPIPNGTTITDANRHVIELRFALRDAAQVISTACTAVIWIGCLLLLYPLSDLKYLPPMRKRFIWLVALIAAAHAVAIPWIILSDGRYIGEYLLPIRKVVPAMLLVLIVPHVAALRKKQNR